LADELSDDGESSDDEEVPTMISEDGRCGEKYGVCEEGYCCSKYGWCGDSEEFCDIEQGCQSKYGECHKNKNVLTKSTTTSTPSPIEHPYRCGEGNGSCPDGYCCSKYGWCGTEEQYCDPEQGCQSEFGKCYNTSKTTTRKTTRKTTTTTTMPSETVQQYQCGEGIGSCPDGYCCSRYGWCGTRDEYCDPEQGCQSEFGKCNNVTKPTPTSVHQYQCGEGIGSCPDGYCCSRYGWCGTKNEYCDPEQGCQSEFGKCNNTTKKTTTTTTTSTPTETVHQYQCGEGIGSCPDGYCCSKYGWCGTKDEYCDPEQGCQSEFGKCNNTAKTASIHYQCGEGIGSCPDGYCCSRYGWCGTKNEYCDPEQGCQSEFGKCNNTTKKTTTTTTTTKTSTPTETVHQYQCGEGIGSCPDGYCCSRYGWCGTKNEYCDPEQGCQSGFGKCNNTTKKTTTTTTTSTPTETVHQYQCGEGIGSCPDGYCCSKYGWCGTKDEYCDPEQGCQSEFGKCNNTAKTTSIHYQCGESIGSCPDGYCCSRYGWCGTKNEYCDLEQGCQSEFGKCNNTTKKTTITLPVNTSSTITTTTTTTATINRSITTSSTQRTGKCGKGYGSCPSGYCCNKYGWCGVSDTHCNVKNGCQSEFGACKDDNNAWITTTAVPQATTTLNSQQSPTISADYKCGEGIGKCPNGLCCSKYGYCGSSNSHCAVDQGCQSEFGQCNGDNNKSTPEGNNEGRCGQGIGSCKEGFCCSKYGYCGSSDSYCSVDQGCQSEYGTCNNNEIKKLTSRDNSSSHLWRCGEGIGSCQQGYCCSSNGLCGKSNDHCSLAKGCQSKYGECSNEN